MREVFAKLRRQVRHLGLLSACYWVVHNSVDNLCLQKWISIAISDLYFAETSQLPRGRRLPKTFVLRLAGIDDAPAISMFYAKPAVIAERFREGHRCILLLCRDKIQAAEWVAVGPTRYTADWSALRCVFHVMGGAGWIFDGVAKVRGAWGALMRMLPEELESLGISSVYFRVDHDNFQSLASHQSLGYARLGTICHFRVADLSLTVYKMPGQGWRRLPFRLPKLEIGVDMP